MPALSPEAAASRSLRSTLRMQPDCRAPSKKECVPLPVAADSVRDIEIQPCRYALGAERSAPAFSWQQRGRYSVGESRFRARALERYRILQREVITGAA